MSREEGFVAAAIANNTDLIPPETRIYLDGLDLAAARHPGTLVEALSRELNSMDRSSSPGQILQKIDEFKVKAARERRQSALRSSGFASSTMMEGWHGTVPPSPFSERAASDGSEAAVQVRTGTSSAPQQGDSGGVVLTSPELLSVTPPGSGPPGPRVQPPPPPPSDETSAGARTASATYAEAAAGAGITGSRPRSAAPRVRDSGLGTSAAVETILEESLQMMRESASAEAWHNDTVRAVERLEAALQNRRVSDIRRQVKEILPLHSRREADLPRDAREWPAEHRQAILAHLFTKVNTALVKADTFLGTGMQLEEFKNRVLHPLEGLLRITDALLGDPRIATANLARLDHLLEKMRDGCQEVQTVLAPLNEGRLEMEPDEELAELLRSTSHRVASAWRRATDLRRIQLDAAPANGRQRVKPLPLPAVAATGHYVFAPADVTAIYHGHQDEAADMLDSGSDELGRQIALAEVFVHDNITMLRGTGALGDATYQVHGHHQDAPAASGGQPSASVETGPPPAMGAGGPGVAPQWAPFGGPPLATSEERPADIGGPRTSDEDPENSRIVRFPRIAGRGRGKGLPLSVRPPGRDPLDDLEAGRAALRRNSPSRTYRGPSSTDWETSVDQPEARSDSSAHVRFSEDEAASRAGHLSVPQPMGRSGSRATSRMELTLQEQFDDAADRIGDSGPPGPFERPSSRAARQSAPEYRRAPGERQEERRSAPSALQQAPACHNMLQPLPERHMSGQTRRPHLARRARSQVLQPRSARPLRPKERHTRSQAPRLHPESPGRAKTRQMRCTRARALATQQAFIKSGAMQLAVGLNAAAARKVKTGGL